MQEVDFRVVWAAETVSTGSGMGFRCHGAFSLKETRKTYGRIGGNRGRGDLDMG